MYRWSDSIRDFSRRSVAPLDAIFLRGGYHPLSARSQIERTTLSILKKEAYLAMKAHFLELKNIIKSFGKVSAVHNVNFHIKGDPEIVALIGDNGAGKSTLIKIISGVHTPDSGEICIRGEQMKSWSVVKAREAGVERALYDPDRLFARVVVR